MLAEHKTPVKKEPKIETSFFKNLPSTAMDILLSHAKTRSFKKNSIIMTEGDNTDSLYLVKSGRVKIYVSEEDGKELTLNMMEEGDYFGELSLLDGNPRSTSAITVEKTDLLVIQKNDFKKVLNNNPEVAINIIAGLSQLLRQLTMKTRDIALLSVYERIAVLLQRFAIDKNDQKIIEPKLTHAEMASMLGCRREMVSRIMSDLSKGGYITLAGNSIVINRKLPAKW